jgi:hypothetical protein
MITDSVKASKQDGLINHQPSTSTIDHQPSTINHQPSTINHQPSNHQVLTTSVNHGRRRVFAATLHLAMVTQADI